MYEQSIQSLANFAFFCQPEVSRPPSSQSVCQHMATKGGLTAALCLWACVYVCEHTSIYLCLCYFKVYIQVWVTSRCQPNHLAKACYQDGTQVEQWYFNFQIVIATKSSTTTRTRPALNLKEKSQSEVHIKVHLHKPAAQTSGEPLQKAPKLLSEK